MPRSVRKPSGFKGKTYRLNVEENRMVAVMHKDCMLLVIVQRFPWQSKTSEGRIEQMVAKLQEFDGEVIPFDKSWWPLEIPEKG